MKIILDANFFLIPANFKVDVFEELDRIIEGSCEVFTIKPVVRELRGLAREKGKDARAARVGLQLLEKKAIKVLKTKEKDADRAIIKMPDDFVVATLDVELRKKLLKTGKKVIYLRAKKYLVLG